MLGMVVRGTAGQTGSAPLPISIPVDPRRDMMKELQATMLVAELAALRGVLKEIVTVGERGVDRSRKERTADLRPALEGRDPTSTQVQRALQSIQKDAGLPITGRFDDATQNLLLRLGVIAPPPEPAPPPPEAVVADTNPAPLPKKPIDAAAQQVARQSAAQREQLLKSKVETQPLPPRPPTPPAATTPRTQPPATPQTPQAPQKEPPPPDRALDPARLLASLVAAGFTPKGAGAQGMSAPPASSTSTSSPPPPSSPPPSPQQALQAFQVQAQLKPTAQLDKPTIDALVKAGIISPEQAASHERVREATTRADSGSARAQADTTTTQALAGSGAKTQAQVTRAPMSSPEEAREQARLESLLAQAAATERGVQEGKGDPTATMGHGVEAGASTGITGAGAQGGGADTGGNEASVAIGVFAGEESSTGNAHGGDDDHTDDARGEASDALGDLDDEDGVIPDGHYRVQKLSVQVVHALDTILRLDEESGPVCYTWDVTLYRPGVYADGQPAQEVWHLVVDRAHAFDPVWRRAIDAIAARLLYVEPEATPPSLDDVLGALRRARVRETTT